MRMTLYLMLAFVVALAGCGSDDDVARERFREAVTDQDLVAARRAAIELGQELPDTPEAVVEVARLLGEIGEMNQARWMLQEALARHPGNVDLIFGLTETSLRVGDAIAAAEALDSMPADTDRGAYVEILRSQVLVLTGRLDEALSALVAADGRFDEPVLFRMERIKLLQLESRFAEALAIVREMQADPDVHVEWQPTLGLKEAELVRRTEGGEAALVLLDPMVEAEPARLGPAVSHTSILIELGRADEALARLRRAIESNPDAAALNSLAAQAAMVLGDVEAAEGFLRQHAEVEPTAVTLSDLATFLHEQGRAREAAVVLQGVPENADPLQRIELHYQGIAMQIELGDLDAARVAIDSFGRDYPRNPRLDYLLARLDLAEGRPEAAAQRLALVAARLDRSDVKHLLGAALEQSGDYEGAEMRYGIVLTKGRPNAATWAGLLRVLEAQKKWDALAGAAEKAARFAPIRDAALQALVRAKLAMGELADAELVAAEHLKESPELTGPRVLLSVALRRQGRLDEALGVLAQATEAGARDPALVGERVTVLGMAGRVPEALDVLAAVEAEGVSAPSLRRARIYLLMTSGHGEEALEAVARAAEIDAGDAEPHRMAADYLASTGRFDASIEHYQRAVERSPAAGDLFFRMAIALERVGRDAEAIEAYRRVIELDGESVGARNNLALMLGRAGETREALKAAQAAYARAETDPVVMDTLASLYLDAGLARRAAAMLEKARGLAPGSADVAYHLGLAYRDSGREDAARQVLGDLAASIDGDHALHGRVDDALRSMP